jgi:hypothetical protein
MLLVRWIACVAMAVLLGGGPAAEAQERFALLIGNQGYSDEIGRLGNPHNDVARLEQALRSLKFDVATVYDAGLAELHRALNAYIRRVRASGPGAVAFLYYSGHGAADAGGTNYLIPVDALSSEEGALWDQSLRFTEITRKLKAEAANAVHFVVFDACRNVLKVRKAGSRAVLQARGLSRMEQESGMLIAYATAEGETASDSGAYAAALAEEIVKPGVEAVSMFRAVQLRVKDAIGQEPWIGFNALGKVHFAGQSPEKKAGSVALSPKIAPEPPQPNAAAEAWDRTKDTQSVAVLETFIRRFGETYYGDLAKARIAKIKQAKAAVEAAEASKREALEGKKKSLAALVSACGKSYRSIRERHLEDRIWMMITVSFNDAGEVVFTEDHQKREMYNYSFRPKKLLDFVTPDITTGRAKLSELDPDVQARNNTVIVKCARSACFTHVVHDKKTGAIQELGSGVHSASHLVFCDAPGARRIADALSELIKLARP